MPGLARNPATRYSRAHRRDARTHDATDRVELPVENALDAPPLPAGFDATDDEHERWSDLWATGESTQWSDADLATVATLVRLQSRVYDGSASSADLSTLRSLTSALGLTPESRARLGWVAAS